MDLELRKRKKKPSDYRWRLGVIRYEFTHGWRALGEERSPTHRKVPAFMMPERRGSEAHEDEEEVHRGKEAGGTVPRDAEGPGSWRAPGGA